METQTKPKRETWRDWMPSELPEPDEMLTRDQVVSRLREQGVDVTIDNLRYWEQIGVLPHPVRRWHEGAVRAVYHPATIHAVDVLRVVQSRGWTLDELRSSVRFQFAREAISQSNIAPEKAETLRKQLSDSVHFFPPAPVRTALVNLAVTMQMMTGDDPADLVVSAAVSGKHVVYRLIPESDGSGHWEWRLSALAE